MSEFIRKYFGWLFTLFVVTVGQIKWKRTKHLSDEDLKKIQDLLSAGYYIICTRSPNHMSTYLIGISDWLINGKFGYYGHALMNLEGDVNDPADFRLVEATLKLGTSYDPFDLVFHDASAVALLKPKKYTVDEWVLVMERAMKDVGKKYDTLYDFVDDTKVSCIELVMDAIKADPNYQIDFANFDALSKKHSEITPQMLYNCPDFEVAFEIRVP